MTEGVFRLDDALTKRARAARKAPHAVVLAGGRGTRLAPYTSVLPKPLMPIGDRSILELVLEQLRSCGITSVTLCVGYLSHLISAVLDNGGDRGLDIRYVREEFALGTAAPLRLVPELDDTFIVMNGDVLTTMDFGALVRYHRRAGNMLTIATHERTIKIDYGVLRLGTNGRSRRVEGYDEKPELKSHVSMGIYVMEPAALERIPPQGYLDFPDLVRALLADGARVGSYAYDGLWFDIGRRSDYETAVNAWFEHVQPEADAATLEPGA